MARLNKNNPWNWLLNTKVRNNSIKKRLLIRIALILFLTWILAAVATKFFAWDTTSNFLYGQVESMADNWMNIIESPNFSNIEPAQDSNILLLGWRADKQVLRKGPFELMRPEENITHRIDIGDDKWMISSLCIQENCVTIGLKDSQRKCAVQSLMLAIFIPLAIIFLLAMLAMYYAVNSGLRPLSLLTKKVASVSVEQLRELPNEKTVSELSPLVTAINQLLYNMKNQLKKERFFLDTCTHELRTPVTALLAVIQNLEPANDSLINTTNSLQQLKSAGVRTVRVANQFLNLAKNSNAEASAQTAETFDLPELNRQVIADILTSSPQVICDMEGLTSLKVNADSLSMEMVCRNLIENAHKYGINADTGKVYCIVTLIKKSSDVILIVEDDGAGVSNQYLPKLSERFYRTPSQNDKQSINGAGLGLSIVEEVAARYQGNVHFEKSSCLGGLKVTVLFRNIIN